MVSKDTTIAVSIAFAAAAAVLTVMSLVYVLIYHNGWMKGTEASPGQNDSSIPTNGNVTGSWNTTMEIEEPSTFMTLPMAWLRAVIHTVSTLSYAVFCGLSAVACWVLAGIFILHRLVGFRRRRRVHLNPYDSSASNSTDTAPPDVEGNVGHVRRSPRAMVE